MAFRYCFFCYFKIFRSFMLTYKIPVELELPWTMGCLQITFIYIIIYYSILSMLSPSSSSSFIQRQRRSYLYALKIIHEKFFNSLFFAFKKWSIFLRFCEYVLTFLVIIFNLFSFLFILLLFYLNTVNRKMPTKM